MTDKEKGMKTGTDDFNAPFPEKVQDVRTPISLAVTITLCLVTLFIGAATCIGGSYLLTLNTIHTQIAQQQALKSREEVAAIRTAIPTCKAIVQLEHATEGKVSQAFKVVADNTHCTQIVEDLNHGMNLHEILVQQTNEAAHAHEGK